MGCLNTDSTGCGPSGGVAIPANPDNRIDAAYDRWRSRCRPDDPDWDPNVKGCAHTVWHSRHDEVNALRHALILGLALTSPDAINLWQDRDEWRREAWRALEA